MGFLEDAQRREAWDLIEGEIPEVAAADWKPPNRLLPPGDELHQALAIKTLRERRSSGRYDFLTSEQLNAMAKDTLDTGLNAEEDITQEAGVYIFVSLIPPETLKVGETEGLRRRVGREHMRYGHGHTDSNLCAYFTNRGYDWPRRISDKEIVALAFPLPGSSELERKAIEKGLRSLLNPEMP